MLLPPPAAPATTPTSLPMPQTRSEASGPSVCTCPWRNPGEPVHRADLALGEHSAGHLCRVLRLYLKAWELLFLGGAAEAADSSPAMPLAITGDPLDDRGRGLILVGAATDAWGIVKHGTAAGRPAGSSA